MPLFSRFAVALCALFLTAAADPWLEDLEALKAGLARDYANFEYNLIERRVDLPAIAADVRRLVETAADDAAKRRAFEALLAQFRDPHVRIEWPAPGAAEGGGGGGGEGGPLPCLGPGAPAVRQAGLRWERHPDFAPLDTPEAAPFRAGMLAGGNGGDGVVRLPIFIPEHYAQVCRAAAADLAIPLDAPCDGPCRSRLDLATGRRLSDMLRATLAELERRGARRIVVDLSDNSGGSDWVESVIRILGGRIEAAEVAMLRHPAWSSQLADIDGELERMLGSARGAERERLRALRARLAAARAEVARPCDLSAAWTDAALATGARPLPCTTLVGGLLYSTGLDRHADSVPEGDNVLFSAARYGPWQAGTSLPLVVLIGNDSHSAAELAAAALADNGRAVLVGAPTPGAGCGHFTGRGSDFPLPNSGAIVRVPDCVRLRADGSNERRGIVPHLLVPWAPADSAWIRLDKAVRALRSLP